MSQPAPDERLMAWIRAMASENDQALALLARCLSQGYSVRIDGLEVYADDEAKVVGLRPRRDGGAGESMKGHQRARALLGHPGFAEPAKPSKPGDPLSEEKLSSESAGSDEQLRSEQSESGAGFATFTLAELTLIQQGLWAIGSSDAVDHRLIPDWRGLLARLRPAIQNKVAEWIEEGRCS